jgi:pyruvate dehydrogenase E2 component (dihydrolipoamide acetyltransferase)
MSNIYPIAVPKWGIEMTEGTISTWHFREGDSVRKGDEVFEMESDKIVNVWDCPVDGVLRRILVQEGDTHPVGTLLGVIADAEVDDTAIDAFVAGFGQSSAADSVDNRVAVAPPVASGGGGAGDASSRSSPSVRALARELGVDLNTVTGTGRRGRITEEDVKAAAGGSAAPQGVDVVPLSATRKTIARRLTEAKQQIPHFYLTVDYCLDGLLSHRKSLNNEGGQKVSVNDLLVWCVGRALMKEPRVNVNLVGDDVHIFRSANIAVAIATDDGLYPATVYGAESLSPREIATKVAELSARATAGALTREDITGGSFTVSNLGMYGVGSFTAIINPPMGAILALGRAQERVVVESGAPAIATMVSATLSCDHRVIDGAVGAQFLQLLGAQIAALS